MHAGLHKAGVVIVGLAASFAACVAGAILSLLLTLDCEGSDVSDVPFGEGDAICEGATADIVIILGWTSATAAPFLGMLWALLADRWKPLWIGCGAALGVLLVYSLLVPSFRFAL